MLNRTRKGFTLVEIMIVVAIIGILVAIAVPGFIKARNTSRTNACQENMTKVDGAVQQYILDENHADVTAAGCLGTGWNQADIVGPTTYLRVAPECPAGPAGAALYEVGDPAAGDDPVSCVNGPNLGATLPEHIYPET